MIIRFYGMKKVLNLNEENIRHLFTSNKVLVKIKC